ncbi:DMT family transporter [Taklimakanibacter deserti]|uniref:DMT family transporter n=1 Tax=Taklimakanibacter deserti TaxID=2267839 RepID=UPI0013C49720
MAPQTPADNKLLAVLYACGAVGIASCGDAVVKWLSGSYAVHQILVIRCLIGIPILAFIVHRNASLRSLLGPGTGLSLMRAAIMSSAYLAFILSIAAMPLADSVAIYFVMPLFVAVIAGPMLGERVRVHRWIAIIGGFIGVMIMINPGSGVLEPAALLALYSAIGYAVSQTLARRIVRTVPPATMAFHTNAVYLAVAVSLALIFTFLDMGAVQHKSLAFLARPWQWPPLLDFAAMLLLGATVAIAMVLFAMAYKSAESSFVAPFEYSAMFWAAALGFLAFGDVPSLRTLWGGAIVLLAGLFMLWADRRIDRQQQSLPSRKQVNAET